MNNYHDKIDAAVILENNARRERDQTYFDSAIEHYTRALRIRKGTMKPNDLTIADVLINMSEVYLLKKHKNMAVLMSKQALAMMNRHQIRYDSRKVTTMLNSIGKIFFESGKHELAINCYEQNLESLISSKEADISTFIPVLENLTRIYRTRQQYDKAIDIYKHFILKQRKVLGSNHAVLYNTINQLAQLYLENKEYAKAIYMYKKALQVHTDENRELRDADIHESIGMSFLKIGNFHMAVKNFLKSKFIKTSVLGENSVTVALILYKIATAYLMKGDEEHSIFYYNQNLRILRVLYGDNHMDIALTLKRLGSAQRQRGHLLEAVHSFKGALHIEKKIHGEYHLSVAKTLNLIGNIYLQKAEISEAKSAFTLATRILRRCGKREVHLRIDSMKFYELSILHPEAAAVA